MPKPDRITRTTVRGLSRGEKATAKGIIAEKLDDGDVRYSVQVMVDGRRIARVIGKESEGVTPTQAEEFIAAARTKAREERLELPQGRKLHQTFAEASKAYLARLEESGGKDMDNKRRHLDVYLVPELGSCRLDQLSTFQLQRYRKARKGSGASDATVNRELATFLHLMNRAADWKWIRIDQKPPIPRVAEERKPRRALTGEQADALLQAAIADHDPHLWLFVAIGLGTGMRHSEIVCRRYDEIDWNANRFEIGRAKAGARLQPFPQWVRECLERQRATEDDKDGWIFPAVRKTLCKKPHRTTMDDGFRRAAVAAGLDPERVTPHLLRHTLITRLSKTADVSTIKKISGHKTERMVFHYIHAEDDAASLALDGLFVPRTITTKLPVEAETGAELEQKVVDISSAKSAA